MSVTAQRDDPVGIYIDGGDHIEDVAQRAERALDVRGYTVDLAVYEGLDGQFLGTDDDCFYRWGGRRLLRRFC